MNKKELAKLIAYTALLLSACLLSIIGIPSCRKTREGTELTSEDVSETGYWMTSKSHIRHNKKCKYYMKSDGRVCKPDEGRTCKICGG